MVFCGKPSKGCGMCRARKIKCDQSKPSCSQCGKTRLICPGYRDQLTLMFRDESGAVTRKARAQQAKTTQRKHRVSSATREKHSPSTSPSCRDTASSRSQSPKSHTVPFRTLSSSLDQQGLCFFHTNYVYTLRDDFKSHQDYVNVIRKQSVNNGAASSALAAVGLAGLSNMKKAPEIMMVAREKYTSALNLTNAALQDPLGAKSDLTLMAILLLSMYEVITCGSPRSLKSWTNHIYGAAALLELRGPEQFQDRTGLHLFLQLRSQILISCLQREAHVPNALRKWSKEIESLQTENELHANKLADIVTVFTDTRARMKDKIITDSRTIISAMLAIETSLVRWSTEIPPDWTFAVVPSDDSDDFYQGHYHIYHDTWMAGAWDNYRCVRILINEILLDHVNRVFASASPFTPIEYYDQCRRSRRVLHQMSSDICTSVSSFHLSQPKECGHVPRAASGFLLIWPLYVAGGMEGATDTLRSWVIQKLESIGLALGIRQAVALAGVLRKKQENVVWCLELAEKASDSEDCSYGTYDGADESERERSEWIDYSGAPGPFY